LTTEFVDTHAAVRHRIALPISELSLSLAVCLTTAAGVAVVLLSAPATATNVALPVFVLGAGAMFGVGLTDLARGGERRYARAVILAGVLWSLSALSASQDSLAYSAGHVCQWLTNVAIAYLLLSYPNARLVQRADRVLFGSVALLVGVLFVPTALLGPLPHPSLWSACTSGCPRDAFALGSSHVPVRDGVVALRVLLAVALFAAIAVVVTRRARRAEPVLGQLYAPVAAFAILQAALFAVWWPLRVVAPSSGAVLFVSWIFVLTLPAVAVVCRTSSLYRRLRATTVLDRVARNLVGSTTVVDVRIGLADALEDPSLRILHSIPGDVHAWVDEAGSPVKQPRDTSSAPVAEVSSGMWSIAIRHDPSLSEDRALVVSAGSYALAALENHRLTDELQQSVLDLAESRASRIAAEQEARQKIERDLHDGAQQRLVALRLKLGLVADNLVSEDPAGAGKLRALGEDVDATIDEVRALASGIYPPQLARTGLGEALRAVSRVAALPTTVRAEDLGRFPPEVETTVYFSCSEGLQNAAKHARSATAVSISVWCDDALHFEIRDDGAGFDPQTSRRGAGLSNLEDRLVAVGGTMTIRSIPGQGTVLGGSIPLA
jgi:signal transduction histidine kinase